MLGGGGGEEEEDRQREDRDKTGEDRGRSCVIFIAQRQVAAGQVGEKQGTHMSL